MVVIMIRHRTNTISKVTVEISTSVLYPWKIDDYFKYHDRKYRIEKIIREAKYACVDGIISEISDDTPIQHQIIMSLVIGALVR
ncbi:hypothetical protein Cha6605_5498 [Chamaesiphon minutus PCC 6605]|uniref:Uncharacterized protein n=1 Tax=Chamaesiphon minutus (strain ATCC 27169 / PCC 6605) TaxID=1173020 RepID=K9UNJ5_CHAP6|nr:hypothetical protein Cha6605_5498 [Chamaesiphon minutus PCC 6605]